MAQRAALIKLPGAGAANPFAPSAIRARKEESEAR